MTGRSTDVIVLFTVVMIVTGAVGGIRWVFSPVFRGRTRARTAWPRVKMSWIVVGILLGLVIAGSGMELVGR